MKTSAALTAALSALAALAAAMPIVAQGGAGEAAAKARHDHMKALGASSKAVYDQLKSGSPNLAVVRAEAVKIDAAGKGLPTWFPAGSGPGGGFKTHALAVVWSDPAGFAARQRTFAVAAAHFDAVAQGGDAAALPLAFAQLGDSCKGCHTKYRVKDED